MSPGLVFLSGSVINGINDVREIWRGKLRFSMEKDMRPHGMICNL